MKQNNKYLSLAIRHSGKITLTLFFILCFHWSNASGIMQKPLNIQLKKATAKELFDEINRKTGTSFIYSNNDVDTIPRKDYLFNNTTIEKIINYCLEGSHLAYNLENNTIFIRKIPEKIKIPLTSKVVKGKVTDDKGEPLMFANVIIKNSSVGCVTKEDGSFSLTLPPAILARPENIIVFSFVEMKSVEIAYTGQEYLEAMLKPDGALQEVIVTGIYERKKESFTGSSATYKASELKRVGSQNIIQSLKALDPAFNVMENNLFGSDPNKLPDIEVRGKSSVVGLKEQYGTDPNQPLFILDGFETTLQTVMDLNLDRIASVTLLKDAASTAIYGSKAANGVVVIETKAPQKGSLRISYKGDYEINMPDFSGYNLMDAAEKIQFEYLSKRYEAYDIKLNMQLDSLYQARRADVARGVNTYWLSEPTRLGFSHRHNIYAEGGDEVLRYGIGLTYNNIEGVLKESSRDIMNGNIDLLYRKGQFRFSNKMTVEHIAYSNPGVSFKEFAQTNPYYRKTDANGDIVQYLERSLLGNLETNDVQNPLWDNSLNNYDKGKQFGIRNNFITEWQPLEALKFRFRFGLTKNSEKQETFYDPKHSKFNNLPSLERGEYSQTLTEFQKYEGDIATSYGKLFADKHQLNVMGGWNFNTYNQEITGFKTIGFNNGDFNRPSFSGGYPEGGKPLDIESESRATSLFLNGGYSYDNRYLLDLNYRLDGSSLFGSNKKFTNTWSLGLAWNLYNEEFIRKLEYIDLLKIRFSVGNPGNQNFDSYIAYTTYKFNESYLNNFGNGTSLQQVGNPDLMWQKTLDKNIGFDAGFFSNRLNLTVDYYNKKTDPLLARINMPASTGVSEINTNLGMQKTKGISGTIKYSPWYKPEERINWTLSVNVRHEKAAYAGIDNKLDNLNDQNKNSKNYERYYNGGSPTAIWAVRSAGIDPASGRELFIKKNGETDFVHSFEDEVVVGNTMPKAEGIIGSVFYYKGFSFSMYFRYRLGGQIFNNALYEKVENISLSGLKYNQDKRALYDRWQKPGDHARFKSISTTEETPMSSRFVMDENTIIGESFQMGYEFSGQWMKSAGLSALTIQAFTNNIFRCSSVKDERGIEYPFARSASISVSLTF